MIIRYLFSFFLAFMVTFGIFFWMQYLISDGGLILAEGQKRMHIDLGDVREVEDMRKIERKPEEIIPEQAPETNFLVSLSVSNISDPINLTADDVETANVNTNFGGSFIADGEYLPIVRVPPQFPARAAERGLEGYVIVKFSVTPNGSTTKVVAIEASDKIFIRNAIRAAERFKYKPKVVDGEPVLVEGIRMKIDFKFEA